MSTTWEYATIEWSWDDGEFRIDLPGGEVDERTGSYAEAVEILNEFGADGWDMAGKVAVGDWIFYTLKRPSE